MAACAINPNNLVTLGNLGRQNFSYNLKDSVACHVVVDTLIRNATEKLMLGPVDQIVLINALRLLVTGLKLKR